MHSPPPDPQAVPTHQTETTRQGHRNNWLIAGLGFIAILLLVDISMRAVQSGFFGPQSTQTPISLATLAHTPTKPISSTSQFSATPEITSTPEDTATPEISPTPFPLPIREDFSKQYSDLWQVIGNPFITESGFEFSGILTVATTETASMSIGNSAWTDYIVSFRIFPAELNTSRLRIGVRVKDLNNMVLLDRNVSMK